MVGEENGGGTGRGRAEAEGTGKKQHNNTHDFHQPQCPGFPFCSYQVPVPDDRLASSTEAGAEAGAGAAEAIDAKARKVTAIDLNILWFVWWWCVSECGMLCFGGMSD